MEETPKTESRGGKRCAAWGCSSTYKDSDVSLHSFPFDRPEILRQWITFVKTTRKDWSGPTKYNVLCSNHFVEDSHPEKYRLMECMGQTVTKRKLNNNAVPTKHVNEVTPKQNVTDVHCTWETHCRPNNTMQCPKESKKGISEERSSTGKLLYHAILTLSLSLSSLSLFANFSDMQCIFMSCIRTFLDFCTINSRVSIV